MKPVPASLVALTIGWLIPLGGLGAYQLATTGRASDMGVTAIWTGLFAFFGWAIFVAPLISRVHGWRLASDWRWAAFGWSAVAILAFVIIAGPILGAAALEILWYPAVMGALSGPAFSLLLRRGSPSNV